MPPRTHTQSLGQSIEGRTDSSSPNVRSRPRPPKPMTASGARASCWRGALEQEHHQGHCAGSDGGPKPTVDVPRAARLSGPVEELLEPADAHARFEQRAEKAVALEDREQQRPDGGADQRVEQGPAGVDLVEQQVGADERQRRQTDGDDHLDDRRQQLARTDDDPDEHQQGGEDEQPEDTSRTEAASPLDLGGGVSAGDGLGDRLVRVGRLGAAVVSDGHAHPPCGCLVVADVTRNDGAGDLREVTGTATFSRRC